MDMASSVMDDTSICNLVKIAPHSYVEHFADKSNVWKIFTYIPDDTPPPRRKNKNLSLGENEI